MMQRVFRRRRFLNQMEAALASARKRNLLGSREDNPNPIIEKQLKRERKRKEKERRRKEREEKARSAAGAQPSEPTEPISPKQLRKQV